MDVAVLVGGDSTRVQDQSNRRNLSGGVVLVETLEVKGQETPASSYSAVEVTTVEVL